MTDHHSISTPQPRRGGVNLRLNHTSVPSMVINGPTQIGNETFTPSQQSHLTPMMARLSPRSPSSPSSSTGTYRSTPLTPAEAQSLISKRGLASPTTSALHPRNTVPQNVKCIATEEVVEILKNGADDALIIDVRPFAQFSVRRIKGARSVCIPSTLLKRASFSLEKMLELVGDATREELVGMSKRRHVILYDQYTRDLHTCGQNALYHTINKISSSDYLPTHLWYLMGGFQEFNNQSNEFVDNSEWSKDGSPSEGVQESLTTPFNLQPVLTTIKANPSPWGILPTSTVAEVDTTKVAITPELVMEAQKGHFPPALANIILKTNSAGTSNPVAEKFRRIQASEHVRIAQASSREPKSGIPDKSNGRLSARPPGDGLSPMTLTPVTADRDDIEYSFFAGSDQSKNRYSNIRPYFHSRVMLKDSEDYLNANYVGTSISKLKYIATQAPVPNSFGEFWDAVFEHRVPVIMMLTELVSDGGQIKSHKYWDLGVYGDIEIVNVVELHHIDYVDAWVRSITLRRVSDPSKTHKLCQIHYLGWADLDCPNYIDDIIGLIRLKTEITDLYQSQHDGSQWVVVHCSAGCGRTGTFCVVDSLMDHYTISPVEDHFKDQRDLVFECVKELRTQRLGMVQVQRQFAFCYDLIIYWYKKKFLNHTI